MPALDCGNCEIDDRQLEEWRANGGQMPRKVCQVDHRPTCKTEECNERHDFRTSGYCDKCYTKHRKKRNGKPRLNPLDVLKIPGQWVIK